MNLTLEQYESLIALARQGAEAADPPRVVELEQWLQEIERANGISRSFLWVQWQEVDAPLPPGTSFPDKWPPEMRKSIELVSRPIAKVDVEALLASYAREPVAVLVTPDPAGRVGWTELDAYFIT